MYMHDKKMKTLFVYLLEQNVREHYQNAADTGPIIDLSYKIQAMFFNIDVEYGNTTDGWIIDSNKQCKV